MKMERKKMINKLVMAFLLSSPLLLFCAQPHKDSIHIKAVLSKEQTSQIQAQIIIAGKTLTLTKFLSNSSATKEQAEYSYDDAHKSDEKHRKEFDTHYQNLKLTVDQTETQAHKLYPGCTSFWQTRPDLGLVHLGTEGAADGSPRSH